MHEKPRTRMFHYGLALLAPAVTLLLRWPLEAALGDRLMYMTFFPAILVVAYFGGLWPGLLATVLSALAARYFLVSPIHTFEIATIYDTLALSLLVLVGALISILSESLHGARRRIVADERRRAEEARRETEERFRQLAENIHEIFWMMDARQERVLYISPGYEEVSGRTCQSLYDQPRSWIESIHPDDRDRVIEQIKERGHGSFTDSEFRVVRPAGSARWIRNRAFFIKDQKGELCRLAGLAEHITDRKRAEQALRENEHRWRSLTEALPHLVWTATPDGTCDYFSRQWTEHTGVPESDLLGWRWMETLHPDDREPTRRLWTDSVAGRGPYDVEYRVRRSDGEYRWFKTRGVPIRDSKGDIFKWFGTCTDFTDLKRAQEALRESEERFRGTFENAAVGMAHVDVKGQFLRVNQKLCDIVGYSREELLAKTFQDLTYPEDLAADLEQFNPLVQGDLPSFFREKRYVRKDGSPVWVALSVSLQHDAAGKPTNTISVAEDISERKHLEEELRHAKEAAEAANRAKDEFLANVSHEIRTPMNAILGMTELTLDTPLTEDQRQSLRTVRSAADNLLGIINDLLDFSKIEAGKLELDPAGFSLRAALGDTLRALAVRAHRKGLELVCHVEPNATDALIGDAGRLRQILLNLVGNAIKFTDEGEVVVRVSQDDEMTTEVILSFQVSDTGIGISHDRQERIFYAFEQEDTSTTRKYGGTGLGLTIAARLVALMGGEIGVNSELGRGSTFTFTARFGRHPDPAQQVAVRPPVLLHDLPVLIVDDNTTNRRILEEWLRGWQMKPTAVGDGVAAMDALWHGTACGRPYALVLLDARMPDTDGLTLAAHIRQRAELSATRIILLTSGDRPGDLARLRDVQVNAHLLKPVPQEELLEKIHLVMSERMRDEGRKMEKEKATDSSLIPHATSLLVLVAEDNDFNAQLEEQLLVRRGHRVQLANNGKEALSLVEKGAFDLLLLDVHMPELDGFQVIRAIRARERLVGGHLPVIALTARSQKEDRERCLEAGMDDFLAKPIQAANLWAAIERVAGIRPSSTAPGSGLLDARVLLAACGGEASILDGICRTFRARLPDHLRAVQDALQGRDAHQLREAAHKLCGMVAAFSTVAGGIASDLEDHAARGQLVEAGAMVDQLEKIAPELIHLAGGLSLENLQRQAVNP